MILIKFVVRFPKFVRVPIRSCSHSIVRVPVQSFSVSMFWLAFGCAIKNEIKMRTRMPISFSDKSMASIHWFYLWWPVILAENNRDSAGKSSNLVFHHEWRLLSNDRDWTRIQLFVTGRSATEQLASRIIIILIRAQLASRIQFYSLRVLVLMRSHQCNSFFVISDITAEKCNWDTFPESAIRRSTSASSTQWLGHDLPTRSRVRTSLVRASANWLQLPICCSLVDLYHQKYFYGASLLSIPFRKRQLVRRPCDGWLCCSKTACRLLL